MGDSKIPNPDQMIGEGFPKFDAGAFGRILHHVDTNRPPEGQETTIPNHPIFLLGFHKETIGSQVNIGAEGNNPVREGDNSTVLYFLIQCFHNLCYVPHNGGVVTIMVKGLKFS